MDELVEEFVSHFDRLRRVGRRTDPDAYAFPNTRGGRISRQRVAKIVGEAGAQASDRFTSRGLPPLPHTTPHTLRRIHVSIALLANRFDVLWVMGQVGHADSKMTMDVYAQLQQRVKREHGRAFDRLVRQALSMMHPRSGYDASTTCATDGAPAGPGLPPTPPGPALSSGVSAARPGRLSLLSARAIMARRWLPVWVIACVGRVRRRRVRWPHA